MFQLFDKLLLLSGGKSYYYGAVSEVESEFESLGHPMPIHINPAEFLLELMNTDFAPNQADAQARLDQMEVGWSRSPRSNNLTEQINTTIQQAGASLEIKKSPRNFAVILMTLVHRSFIKSYRDVVVCILLY